MSILRNAPIPAPAPDPSPSPAPRPERLVSLDAFRGAIMLLMASSGFGLSQIATHFPESAWWQAVARQVEHAEWVGCTLWDLIQPAFTFMVGVALPWSIANRRARGLGWRHLVPHAFSRGVVLILLAVFLSSAWSPGTEWVFTNVLAQIGLGYPFLFILALARPRLRWFAAFSILALYWLVFATHPLPPENFDWNAVGISAEWKHLEGFAAHWEKNTNFAAAFDQWFLNYFPREQPFVFSQGGYQTLSFVPSLVTMLFGLQAGELLRRSLPLATKLKLLVAAGLAGILAGALLQTLGLCPMVKRIWTPSWTLFSGGMVTLLLAGFVAVIEWRGYRRWAFPLVVAGLNPITLYCLWQLMNGFVRDNLKRHLGGDLFAVLGAELAPLLERSAVLLVFWLILFWMYRRRIFIRV